MRLFGFVLVVCVACARPAVVTAGGDASQAATATATASASASAAPLVDFATSATCSVTYSCGLSHPGLGTSMRSTTVDLATCTRSKSSSSGPYENAPTPTATSSKVLPADCTRLRDLVTVITAADARSEQESAHIDSEACTLTVMCGAARDQQKISVQRQSPSAGRVGQVIRAL